MIDFAACGLLSLLAAAGASPPTPEATPSPGAVAHEETAVTADRRDEPMADVPAALSLITREQAQHAPAETLAELLDLVPGFQVLFAPAFGQVPMVHVRGFFGGGEAEYVRLVVDGVPVADVESGIGDWRRLRAEDVERVEVLRGPGSSRYGDTALGGVVQVFTRTSRAAEGGDANVSMGSFHSVAADGSTRHRVSGRRVALAGSYVRSRGFRKHSGLEEASGDAVVAADRWRLMLSASLRDRREPGPRTLAQLAADRFGSDPLFRLDTFRAERLRGALAFGRPAGESGWRLLFHGAVREERYTRTLLVAAGVGDRAYRRLSTGAAGATLETEWRWRLFGAESRFRLGAEAERAGIDTGYSAVDDQARLSPERAAIEARRRPLGVFLSQDWRLGSRLSFAGGLRYDVIAHSLSGTSAAAPREHAWSPLAGLNLHLGPSSAPLSLFVQASRAFKAATLDQLFDPRPFPDLRGGTFVISNPALSPQRATSREAGFRRTTRRSHWEAVAYRIDVEDEIDFDPATFRYRNIGRSVHRGFESEIRLFQGAFFSPQVSYARTLAEPRDGPDAGHQLKNVPRDVLRLGVSLRFSDGFRVALRNTRTEGRFLDDANTLHLPNAYLTDLRIESSLGRVRARLDVLNLTDRDWEEVGYVLSDPLGRRVPYLLPGPGRALRVSLHWAH